MKLIADTHTHSIACDHAYSTITENAMAAKQRGLLYLGITEHGCAMPGAPSEIYFDNLGVLPNEIMGVRLIKGAEVNILDFVGGLDLKESILKKLDWVISSMHSVVLSPQNVTKHTEGWLAIAENPYINVIGHCGNPEFDFIHQPVIKAFRKHNKIVEINTNSSWSRPGSKKNCMDIALLCAEYGVPVVINSDAHYHDRIGDLEAGIELLKEISFPMNLIINADKERFRQAFILK